MKQKLIETIREVSISGKTYEEYVEALAAALDKRFKSMFEEFDVAVKMSEIKFPEGIQIVHDFCEKQKKKVRCDTIMDLVEAFEQKIHSRMSYPGWDIKQNIIPEVVKEKLEEKK